MKIKLPVLVFSTIFCLVSMAPFQTVHANDVQSKVAAEGQNTEKDFRKHFARKLKKMSKKLSLTSDQQEKIKHIFEEKGENRKASKAQMKLFKSSVKQIIKEETFGEEKFSALYAKYQSTFFEAALQKAKSRHAIMQILTEEQQEKFSALMKKKRQHKKGKRG